MLKFKNLQSHCKGKFTVRNFNVKENPNVLKINNKCL